MVRKNGVDCIFDFEIIENKRIERICLFNIQIANSWPHRFQRNVVNLLFNFESLL